MRKIKIEELDKILKLLVKFNISECISGKSKLFFPVDTEKTVEVDTFQFSLKDTNTGAASYVKPGIMVCDKNEPNNYKVKLAYATLEYSPKFNFVELLDILGIKVNKKELAELSELECLLVKNDYILVEFDI